MKATIPKMKPDLAYHTPYPCFLNRFQYRHRKDHMLKPTTAYCPSNLQNFNRCISVLYIIIGKLLAMELLCIAREYCGFIPYRKQHSDAGFLSVSSSCTLSKVMVNFSGYFSCSFCQIACNHRVIACGIMEYLRYRYSLVVREVSRFHAAPLLQHHNLTDHRIRTGINIIFEALRSMLGPPISIFSMIS